MKKLIQLSIPINLSELAQNKIFIDIQPIDDWVSWGYQIYFEDSMCPFFAAHTNGQLEHFKTHRDALNDAVEWLEKNEYIEILELPF